MKLKREGNLILVVGQDGENYQEILEALKESSETPETMVVLSAAGMVRSTKLGFWRGSSYEIHLFPEPAELLAISGMISKSCDPFYHFHLTLALEDGKAVGGHLLEATVHNTLELFLIGSTMKLRRVERAGLKLLDLD